MNNNNNKIKKKKQKNKKECKLISKCKSGQQFSYFIHTYKLINSYRGIRKFNKNVSEYTKLPNSVHSQNEYLRTYHFRYFFTQFLKLKLKSAVI